MVTVKDLRRVAESILEQIEGWNDEDEIYAVHNTYFANGRVLEMKGGFVSYEEIQRECDMEEDD